MKISILFPTASEAAPYIEKYGDDGVSLCGIGLAECAAGTVNAILHERPDFIILAGIAGMYDGSGFNTGDIVNVVRENSADLGTMRSETFVPLSRNGSNVEGNFYLNETTLPEIFPSAVSNSVNTAGTAHKSPYSANADIENMEGAAFFAVCRAFGIKYAELRSISNTVGDHPSGWNIPLATSSLADGVASLVKKLQEK